MDAERIIAEGIADLKKDFETLKSKAPEEAPKIDSFLKEFNQVINSRDGLAIVEFTKKYTQNAH